ncbi:hypothetical protein KUCAC02_022438 [Chaenocephalus aceratus]|uniref:Uncharacterized protein n=1 Tax=Chaenocephalus aceratus TaxID=36190 RepID=A0ACB9XNG4_CHAAC|nr:hypothetical protein KUCAC02_022438 [Chaenocephalus aceratus]
MELTVPWEAEVDEPYNSKWLKDSDIVAEAGQQGWKMWVLLVEVGCGVATSSTSQLKRQEDRYPRQDVKMCRGCRLKQRLAAAEKEGSQLD